MANYPNYIAVLLTVVGFIILSLMKGYEHWRWQILMSGIFMIILASVSFAVFTDMGGLFDLLSQVNKMDNQTHRIAKTAASIWVVMLPAIQGSIGANLIAAWFLSKKPSVSAILED